MEEDKKKTTKNSPNIHKQLLTVQEKLDSIVKSRIAQNGKFSYSYADLAAVYEEAKPVVNEAGLYISHFIGEFLNKEAMYTRITNTDGQFVETPITIPESCQIDMQKYGSAMTYARRYGLYAILAAETQDDDGKNASEKQLNHKAPEVSLDDIEMFDPNDDYGASNAIAAGKGIFRDSYGKENFFGSPYVSTCDKCAEIGEQGLIYMKEYNGKKFPACNNYGKNAAHPKK